MEGIANLCFSSSPLHCLHLHSEGILSYSLTQSRRALHLCATPSGPSDLPRFLASFRRVRLSGTVLFQSTSHGAKWKSMNYTLITEDLIVGSQPQKAEDINHLKMELNVGYILNLQQDRDVEYWGIDLNSIITRCGELGIHHMRRPARDFDPDSLRSGLPRAVSSLEWAISEGNGRVYVHCTAGLGRAPAVVIAYMFWFCDMNLNKAYNALTSKRPCGPNKRAIRGATYDLAKNDPWKEPFECLPEHAFEDVADWERKLIQDRVRALRWT
ncbi:UNVERIFIED_CONTAM: Phosphoglucan phosphatase LSF2, chloroplastic [Sesamum radiatum]|uniref:Phosphoglucan phosphatase LSF2, chloroplastic n=1 Tax=Sesamum radiatum TaxID=300843 RepID=A0AAW2KBY8_SESRA